MIILMQKIDFKWSHEY